MDTNTYEYTHDGSTTTISLSATDSDLFAKVCEAEDDFVAKSSLDMSVDYDNMPVGFFTT